jgi:hypothetical protein
MPDDSEIPRIDSHGRRSRRRQPGLLTKVLAILGGAALLVCAVAISIVLFAVVAAGLLLFGAYVWWKTRDLRKQLRTRPPGGNIIEGEVIESEVVREVPPGDSTKH